VERGRLHALALQGLKRFLRAVVQLSKGEVISPVLRGFIFLVLFFIGLIVWLLCWLAFHIAGGLIHLLLVFAIIMLIIHFVFGRRTT